MNFSRNDYKAIESDLDKDFSIVYFPCSRADRPLNRIKHSDRSSNQENYMIQCAHRNSFTQEFFIYLVLKK
jgi:hypothetical protein